ncbi:hypothetical protein WICPIJ_008510, partial [Wickerhamomyces pijperi]
YEGQWALRTGEYEVLVGPSSDDIELRETFTINKEKLWLGL